MSSFLKYADGKQLAVRKLQHATGKAQAERTYDVLEMWNIKML